MVLSTNIVNTIRRVKHEQNRPEWKYKKLSARQIQILVRHVELQDMVLLDRGNASLLIDCIFYMDNEGIPITDM